MKHDGLERVDGWDVMSVSRATLNKRPDAATLGQLCGRTYGWTRSVTVHGMRRHEHALYSSAFVDRVGHGSS